MRHVAFGAGVAVDIGFRIIGYIQLETAARNQCWKQMKNGAAIAGEGADF